MNIIKGDISTIQCGVIVHLVNNKHVMGAGVAKCIRAQFPKHYDDYKSSTLELGTLVLSHINDKLGVIGLVAQNGYGRISKQYIDYSQFVKCLQQLKDIHDKAPSVKFYMPFGIGCGLAGGNWSIVSKLLEQYVPFVILVDYE